MEESKRAEVKVLMAEVYDDKIAIEDALLSVAVEVVLPVMKYQTVEELEAAFPKTDILKHIEMGYIFGPYGASEHYTSDELKAIYDEVFAEKNPVKPTEDIEPIEEPIDDPAVIVRSRKTK